MKRTIIFLILFLFLAVSADAEITFSTLSFPEDSEYIDLADTVVTDFDAFETFLDRFPHLTRVDMWNTLMTRDLCDRLAARYPDIKWGWTLLIRGKGKDHKHIIRTDDTSFSTLHNNKSPGHTAEDFEILKYCWDLKALDIGHNKVDRLDWLSAFPNLHVLIVACNHITDISPLAGLTHLEYAELFKNEIRDISPLRGLSHLMDLNLCFNKIEDLSVLKELPSLKRLWLFSCSRFNKEPPREFLRELQEMLPDLYIDSTHHPTNGRWRYLAEGQPTPHYRIIQEIFGKDHLHPGHRYIPFEDSFSDD
jgi:hypothetical protein